MDTSPITETVVNKVVNLAPSIPSRAQLSSGIPSAPIAGLPLRRVIPMDLHSVIDYGGGLGLLLAGAFAGTTRARSLFNVLGMATIGVSLLTDYKLSLAKVVPIEVHEVADHGVGLAASIGPFALGFAKREPLISTFAVMLGASQVFASLITDYRARTGVTWGLPLSRAGI